MTVHAITAGNLLTYAVKPTPSPLTAAYDGASLEFMCGTRSGSPVLCDRITIRVPIGAGPEHLTDAQSAVGIKPDLDDTQDPQKNTWSAELPTTSGGMRVFVFKADRDPARIDGWNLRLFLKDIVVSSSTGNVTIEIEEHSQTQGGAWGNPKTTVMVSKAPENFEFHSFHPVNMMVPNGGYPELKWVGSPAEYTMYWGLDSEATMDPKVNPPWSPTEPLRNTTGYMLQAKVESPNGPMFFTLTCVVSVEKPDLEIGKLDVLGRTVLHDGLDVQGKATIFHRRPIVPREVEAGFNIIVPTDGILTVCFPPTGGNAVLDVYTQDMYGTIRIDSGAHTFPVSTQSQIYLKLISGFATNVKVNWFSMGTTPLRIGTAEATAVNVERARPAIASESP